MSKEVIYIDAKDDVTSVIDKIKKAEQKIVALVPPKQIGILQSVVNLQLIAHTAKQYKKVLVIITNQEALIKLTAVAKIPVAKTLTSKPEMPEIPALKVDGDDDLIDGTKLGIGELAGLKPKPTEEKQSGESVMPKLAPAKIKVPNYDKFRKKLLIGGVGAVVLICFLVWALVFAPQADVTITTNTKNVNVSSSVTLVNQLNQTNLDKNLLYAQTQKSSRKRSYEFEVTGQKDIRTAATGTVTLTRIVGGSMTVPAGTSFTSGSQGCSYITVETVTLPGRSIPIGKPDPVDGTVNVKVRATVTGDQCNATARTYSPSISGIAVAKGSEMTGGTSRIVKVMTQADYEKAKTELLKDSHDAAVKELRNKFDSSMLIIEDSLITQESEITTSSKVDEEAKNGKVRLEQTINYQISAFTRKTLEEYIGRIALKNNKSDKIKLKSYNSGIDQIVFSDFVNKDNKMSVRIAAQAQIGPEINADEVKEFIKGKPFGDVQAHYSSIEGIKDVDIKLSPFWVKSIPKNKQKINVLIKG